MGASIVGWRRARRWQGLAPLAAIAVDMGWNADVVRATQTQRQTAQLGWRDEGRENANQADIESTRDAGKKGKEARRGGGNDRAQY